MYMEIQQRANYFRNHKTLIKPNRTKRRECIKSEPSLRKIIWHSKLFVFRKTDSQIYFLWVLFSSVADRYTLTSFPLKTAYLFLQLIVSSWRIFRTYPAKNSILFPSLRLRTIQVLWHRYASLKRICGNTQGFAAMFSRESFSRPDKRTLLCVRYFFQETRNWKIWILTAPVLSVTSITIIALILYENIRVQQIDACKNSLWTFDSQIIFFECFLFLQFFF